MKNTNKIIEGLQKPMWTVPASSIEDLKIKHDSSNEIRYVCDCEKLREAIRDIFVHSTAPFVRIDMSENMKWLNYIHDVAKEALE